MGIPSKKRIKEWFGSEFRHEGIDPDIGSNAIRLSLEKVSGYGRRRADDVDAAMKAIDKVLNAHGVEAIQQEDAWVDNYYHNIIALYVNMGDPYVATVLYDTEKETFHLTTWGDWYERWERRHGGARENARRR